MKAGFGLVALLVSIAILIYVWSMYTAEVSTVSQPAMRQAEQFAGVDDTGMKVKDSIKLDPFIANGRLRYLHVEDIVPQGPMAKYYGLQRDDQILGVLPFEFRNENDAEMAVLQVWESRQRSQTLRVRREGKEFLVKNVDGLPEWTPTGKDVSGLPPDSPAQNQPVTASPQPQQPNETPTRDNTRALDRQLQQIPGIPR